MLVHWISLACMALGAGVITHTLSPICKICSQTPFGRRGWKALVALTVCFVIFYICLLVFFSLNAVEPTIELTVAFLLLAGALFVKLVVTLSQKSLEVSLNQTKEADYTSCHDELTGLPNRRKFLQDIKLLIDSQGSFELLVMDLNKFKQINDAYGHVKGDLLLAAVSNRLADVCIDKRTVYRLGGDEFAMIDHSGEEGEIVARLIVEQFDEPVHFGDAEADLGISVGIAKYPLHGNDDIELLSRADMAMYQAKRTGNPVYLYEEQLAINLQRKNEISSQLKVAVASDQLQLYYQPIYRQDGKSICSVEALLRWPVRDGVFISPEEFIPIAEEEQKVREITNWVVDAATRQLAEWQKIGLETNVNINLSALDLQDPHLWERIKRILDTNGVSASNIVFEVTEGAVLNNLDVAMQNLKLINDAGALIAIDDFGTGYSSLSRLKAMPISQIKVDRSFVMDIQSSEQDASIVNATVYLAQTLGCTVTAEGVETDMAVSMLQSMGCHYLQGFHFCRPLPAEQITTVMMELQSNEVCAKTG